MKLINIVKSLFDINKRSIFINGKKMDFYDFIFMTYTTTLISEGLKVLLVSITKDWKNSFYGCPSTHTSSSVSIVMLTIFFSKDPFNIIIAVYLYMVITYDATHVRRNSDILNFWVKRKIFMDIVDKEGKEGNGGFLTSINKDEDEDEHDKVINSITYLKDNDNLNLKLKNDIKRRRFTKNMENGDMPKYTEYIIQKLDKRIGHVNGDIIFGTIIGVTIPSLVYLLKINYNRKQYRMIMIIEDVLLTILLGSYLGRI